LTSVSIMSRKPSTTSQDLSGRKTEVYSLFSSNDTFSTLT
jgi:hypothetical protein